MEIGTCVCVSSERWSESCNLAKLFCETDLLQVISPECRAQLVKYTHRCVFVMTHGDAVNMPDVQQIFLKMGLFCTEFVRQEWRQIT
jgi:hypothetical protein